MHTPCLCSQPPIGTHEILLIITQEVEKAQRLLHEAQEALKEAQRTAKEAKEAEANARRRESDAVAAEQEAKVSLRFLKLSHYCLIHLPATLMFYRPERPKL